tara:strand:+ start:104 stop:796 length:693 start_codon:yes stop_codon:yes gene_type:complete
MQSDDYDAAAAAAAAAGADLSSPNVADKKVASARVVSPSDVTSSHIHLLEEGRINNEAHAEDDDELEAACKRAPLAAQARPQGDRSGGKTSEAEAEVEVEEDYDAAAAAAAAAGADVVGSPSPAGKVQPQRTGGGDGGVESEPQSRAAAAILTAASAAGLSETAVADLLALGQKLRPGLLEVAASETYEDELPPLMFVAGVADAAQQRVVIDALRAAAVEDWAAEGVRLA